MSRSTNEKRNVKALSKKIYFTFPIKNNVNFFFVVEDDGSNYSKSIQNMSSHKIKIQTKTTKCLFES